jgi:hypothetical protein
MIRVVPIHRGENYKQEIVEDGLTSDIVRTIGKCVSD